MLCHHCYLHSLSMQLNTLVPIYSHVHHRYRASAPSPRAHSAPLVRCLTPFVRASPRLSLSAGNYNGQYHLDIQSLGRDERGQRPVTSLRDSRGKLR